MQLSHSRRNHQRFNACAIVLYLQSQRIFERAALYLRREGLAIHSATDANVVETRVAFNDLMIFTHLDNGFATLAAKLVDMYCDVFVVTLGTKNNHAVVVTNLNVVTRQLTAEVGGTLA